MIADKNPLCCPKTWSVDLVFAFVVGNATGETYIETPSQPAFQGLHTSCSFSTLFISTCRVLALDAATPQRAFSSSTAELWASSPALLPHNSPSLLVLFQAAHQGPSRPAKEMKDASIVQLTAGRLRKGPRTACAGTDIIGQMLTLSTCPAPVCGLQATGEGRHRAGGGGVHQPKHLG